jgi:cytochrome c peroxidase
MIIKNYTFGFLFYGIVIIFFSACSANEEDLYTPTPLPLNIPAVFAQNILPPVIPSDNPQTVEGVKLGKKLFFDKILSGNNTQSCASCHQPSMGFTDGLPISIGVNGNFGLRNSMPLHNLAWNYQQKFNWDGSATTLEMQVRGPITNPFEMNNTWPNLLAILNQHSNYPELFRQAFNVKTITEVEVTKALAQFIRTLISANSRFDKYVMGENTLTPQEINGFNIFMDEDRGDCFHCHGNFFNPLWTDNTFHNNGLDSSFSDLGLFDSTGDPRDIGKFKAPSLRNLAYTAPYMHDGRFNTLDQVIAHYSTGLVYSVTIDPLMKAVASGGVQLSAQDKADLKAFLLSLSDDSFINNPDFRED